MTEFVITKLAEKHIPKLAKIEAKLFSQPWSAKAFAELLTHDYCHYLVAEKDGEAIGFIGMTVSFGEGEIDKVMVDPDFQRQGAADALMEALFQQGEDLGVQAYTLEVRVSNTAAIKLYEKHGFLSEGVRPGFYEKPKEDALILWKR